MGAAARMIRLLSVLIPTRPPAGEQLQRPSLSEPPKPKRGVVPKSESVSLFGSPVGPGSRTDRLQRGSRDPARKHTTMGCAYGYGCCCTVRIDNIVLPQRTQKLQRWPASLLASLPKWVAGGHTSLTGEWTCTRITAETGSDVFCTAGSGAERRKAVDGRAAGLQL